MFSEWFHKHICKGKENAAVEIEMTSADFRDFAVRFFTLRNRVHQGDHVATFKTPYGQKVVMKISHKASRAVFHG